MVGQPLTNALGWFGESWGFWIQTSILLLSAIAAIAVIYYNGKRARLRALIDLLVQQKTDQSLQRANSNVIKLRKAGGPLSKHLDPQCQERKDILRVLNNQEFIAVGVRLGCFDENAYKQLQCSNVLRLWDASRGFIEEIRRERQKDTLFQDFERLALRWVNDSIKPIKRR